MRLSKDTESFLYKINSEINKAKLTKQKQDFLLGCYEPTNKVYCELIERTKKLIQCNNLNKANEEIVALSVVYFAIYDYKNGKFWDQYCNKVDVSTGTNITKTLNSIKSTFKEFCIEKNLYFHTEQSNLYESTILMQAIFPNSQVKDLFDFLQELHLRDLEERYDEIEVEELIECMHDYYIDYLSDEQINKQEKDKNLTVIKRQMPVGFRLAIKESPNVMIPILSNLLKYIHEVHLKNPDDVINLETLEINNRFDRKIRECYLQKLIIPLPRTNISHVSSEILFHKALFVLDFNNVLSLQIPRQKIKEQYIDGEIILKFELDERVISQKNLELVSKRWYYTTNQEVIPINNFSNCFSYSIYSNDKCIYKWPKLNRDFIIFNDSGEEILPKNLSDERVKIVTNIDTEVILDDIDFFEEIKDGSNYKIITAYLQKDSVLMINNKLIGTNSIPHVTRVLATGKYEGIFFKDNSCKYLIYKDIPIISLVISYNESLSNYKVCINKHEYKLDDVCTYNLFINTDGSNSNVYIIKLNAEKFEVGVPYNVWFRRISTEKTILPLNFLLSKDTNYKFSKDYYYKTSEATLSSFKTDIQGCSNLYKIKSAYKINYDGILWENTTNIKSESQYSFGILIPVLKWSLGNISSDSTDIRNDIIWYEDLAGDYKLVVTSSIKNSILTANDDEIVGTKKDRVLQYDLKSFFNNYNKPPIKFCIKSRDNNNVNQRLTKIYFKPTIKDFRIKTFPILKSSFKVNMNFEFIGTGNLKIVIIDNFMKNDVWNCLITSEGISSTNEIMLNEGFYNVNFTQDNFMGKSEIIYSETFQIGCNKLVSEFKNNRLKYTKT